MCSTCAYVFPYCDYTETQEHTHIGSYNHVIVHDAYELTAALNGFCLESPARITIGSDFVLPEAVVISHPDIKISGRMRTLTATGGNALVIADGAQLNLTRLALAGGYGHGSGIFVQGGSVYLRHIEISGFTNSGIRFEGPGGFVLVFAAYIHSNTADWGGGVHIAGVDSMFTMYDGVITSNEAAFGGGGVFLCGTSHFEIIRGLVYDNYAHLYGDLY